MKTYIAIFLFTLLTCAHATELIPSIQEKEEYEQFKEHALIYITQTQNKITQAHSALRSFLESGSTTRVNLFTGDFTKFVDNQSLSKPLEGYFIYCKMATNAAYQYWEQSISLAQFKYKEEMKANRFKQFSHLIQATKEENDIKEMHYHSWLLAKENYESLLAYCLTKIAYPPYQ